MAVTDIIRPTGMGNVTSLLSTPSGSSRWQYIDESSPNDSDLVRWNTGSRTWDEYTFGNPTRIGSETIEKIVITARIKASVVSSSPYQDYDLYVYDGTGTKKYRGAQQAGIAWNNNTWELTTNWDGDAWTWDDVDGLYVGLGLSHNNSGTTSCSQLYVTVYFGGLFEYSDTYGNALSCTLGVDTPAISRSHGHVRELTATLGINALAITRAMVMARAMDIATIGLASSMVIEKNLTTWLVVASIDGGTYRTRDGASWAIAAKDATSARIAGTWLAQYDNRLVTLNQTNSGMAYSLVNDIVSTSPDPEAWTDKPNFPNLPATFTGMFVGKDASDNPALYFIAEDGVYYMDVFSNFTFGKTELSWEKNSNSGKKGLYFKGATYVTVDRGIYELQSGVAIPIGPDQDDGLPDDMGGYISDMIGVGFWLVISINGGAGRKSTIMKRHIAGKHWHTVYKTAAANSEINTIVWDDGVLYFGEGTNVKSLPLSAESDNVKLLPSYASQVTGALIYPRFHSEFEGVPKVAQKLRMVTEDCDADNYFTAYYKVNGAASWTSLGTFNTSPRPTALSFTTTETGDGLEFEDIQFKIEMTRKTGAPTERPVLVSLTLDYRVVPDVLYKFRFKAIARTTGNSKGEEVIDQLATTLAKKPLVKFYPSGDLNGTSYLVEMTALPSAQKGTEFGEEGEYDVEVAQVTDS